MTDRSRGAAVATVAAALFCVVLIFLALQIRAGRDPAIGAGTQTAAQAPRQVIVRRIIIRRIVEDDAPAASAPAASRPPTSAPAAPAAPVAPAPVVTRGS